MTEHEKRLRELFKEIGPKGSARQHLRDAMTGRLDAILAEHRAEVEALKEEVQVERERREIAQETGAISHQQVATQRGLLKKAAAKVAAARDAALVEAATEAKAAVLSWLIGKGPDGDCPGYVAGRVAALKSAPASVLPTAKVREVLASRFAGDYLDGLLEQLGLSLDGEGAGETPATRDPCARCGHGRMCHMPGNCNACCTCPAFEPRESTFPPEYEATGELTLASQMDRDAGGCEHNSMRPHVYTAPPESLRGRPRCIYCDVEKPREMATEENGLLPKSRKGTSGPDGRGEG